MLGELAVVSLKRKVRSLETNLLEWRRCTCTFTTSESSCQLVLELSDEDVDDVVLDDAECGEEERNGESSRGCRDGDRNDESRRGKCHVTIDLGSRLRRIEQKRKTKTRCEIEYCHSSAHSSTNGQSDKRVRTEELMASSAKHCQQFIDQVRKAEHQAKRKQSIRLGAVLAENGAFASVSDSGVSSGHSSRGISSNVLPRGGGGALVRGSQILPPKIHTDQFRMPTAGNCNSSSSANTSNATAAGGGMLRVSTCSSSEKSEEISPACITSAVSSTLAVVSGPLSASTPNVEAVPPAMSGNSLLGASFSSITSSRRHHEGADTSRGEPKYNWRLTHRAACARDYESDTLDSSSGGISPRAAANPLVGPRDPTSSNQNAINNNSLNSLASSQMSSGSTASKVLFLSSKPLPQEVFAKRLASLRMGIGGRQSNQQLQQQESDGDGDDDDDDESFDNRRRARMEKLMHSPTSNSPASSRTPRVSSLHSSRVSKRLSVGKRGSRERSATTASGKSTAMLRRQNSGATASVAVLTANLNRLRLRERTHLHHSNNNFGGDGNDHDDDDGDGGDSNNRAELHILMRVEAALRQMEKENVLAKEREALLAQEVQSLRDALRMKSAEKKHVETQFQQLLCEKDEWKQVAQRAESAIVQVKDELVIAREEAQLLQSEKVRLKHQNKELMTHVHRLDSLVYGRF